MRLVMRCAALLYPAAWRARYGAELDALVEDAGGGWRDLLDICKGAIEMQVLSGRVWKFTAACALAGFVIAGVIAVRMPREYRSIGVLQAAGGDSDETLDKLNEAEQKVFSRNSLVSVIRNYDLFKEERRDKPLEDIVQTFHNRAIQVRVLGVPGQPDAHSTFSVSVDYSDPAKAKAVNEEIIARMTAAMKDSVPLRVLDPPSLPEKSFGPNRAAILTAGLFLGIVTAFVLMGIRRWPLVPLAGLLAAVVVLPASYLIADHFLSMAVLRVKAEAPPQAAIDVVKDRAFLQALIDQIGLYRKEPQGAVAKMQQSLQVHMLRPVGPPRRWTAFSVQFEYTDRYKARTVVSEIVARMMAAAPGQIEVLDAANVPEESFEPNRLSIVIAALLVGLAGGAIALALRRHRTAALAS